MVKMIDGGCHVLEGLSVDNVTTEFPKVKLSEAVSAVKASKPCDKLLQKVRLPAEVGGEVDILLGIKYNALFPVYCICCPVVLQYTRLKSSPLEMNILQ